MSTVARPIGVDIEQGRTAMLASARSVPDRMDGLPLTRQHIAIFAVVSLGLAFDLMEMSLGNVLSAVFSAPPHAVEPVQLSWLLSAMFIGAIPGALAAGWLADRYGRRPVLTGILLLLSATSTAGAMSADVGTLIFWRGLSGLALGACPPLIISYVADVMPPARRGMTIMLMIGLASLGPVGMVFLVRLLTPIEPLGIEAWRWAFLAGAAGSAITAAALPLLPESPRWLAARGRQKAAEQALARFERSPTVLSGGVASPRQPRSVRQTHPASDKPLGGRFVLLGAICFWSACGTMAFPLLMGTVLIEKGFDLSDSLFYIGVIMFGPALSGTFASFFLDRIGRRTALIAFTVGMIVSVIAFAASLNPLWLMAAGMAFQFLAPLQTTTIAIYAAELFPTAWRARTSTAAWSLNRLASALVPLVLLPLLKFYGIWSMFSVMISALAICVVLLLLAPPGRTGEALD